MLSLREREEKVMGLRPSIIPSHDSDGRKTPSHPSDYRANMSGSQPCASVAMTAVMNSQLGSYVPAESAYLPIFDAIFTRIGRQTMMTWLRVKSAFM